MAHYIAIVEDAGPDRAVGVWFPDLPGCTSAGDDIDEALRNAPEALELYAESFLHDGKSLPRPRTLTELKADPEIAKDLTAYMVALIELPERVHAADEGCRAMRGRPKPQDCLTSPTSDRRTTVEPASNSRPVPIAKR